MKERPIICSLQMEQAILSGRKTQIRRVMTVQPEEDTTIHVERFHTTIIDRQGYEQPGQEVFGAWWNDGERCLKCHYGGPGDQLWVRHVWNSTTSDSIKLEITDVRVERLQDISEADAMAEGVEPLLVPPDSGSGPYTEGFRNLWTSTHPAGAWKANPYVWVINFRIIA